LSFRLALVGGGRIGSFHAKALDAPGPVELAAVVDPRIDELDGIAGPEVRRYRYVADLLRAEAVDGALVAVPTRHHRAVIGELTAAGIPVLCEKPCGMSAQECAAIGRETEASGALLRVAFWRRYTRELAEVRRRVHGGEFGEVASVFSSQWDEFPPAATFRDPASSGGILVDMGVHDFDLLRWLTGQEIEAVCGYASTICSVDPVIGDPETVNLTVRLSEGTTALISLGRRHPPGELQSLQVVGTQDAVTTNYVQESDSPLVLDAFRRQTEDFASAVGGAANALATVEDAVKALEAAELARGAVDTSDRLAATR
jgi:myo-inositol 2-dehydrogenase/D-chiro-inositol 1-dehydrogenase